MVLWGSVGEPFSSNNCGFESPDVVTIHTDLTHDAPLQVTAQVLRRMHDG